MIAAVEFLGPCRVIGWATRDMPDLGIKRGDPVAGEHQRAWVQVAAVSMKQTQNTMKIFRGLFSEACKAAHGITKQSMGAETIKAHAGMRTIEAVTSSPKALEGARPTFVIANESHLWLHNNNGHEMYDVIGRNATKAKDGAARTLHITNAYEPNENSVLQQVREDWEAEQAEGIYDTGLLYDSLEMPSTTRMRPEIPPGTTAEEEGRLVRAHLSAIVAAVRGDAVWLDIEGIVNAILGSRAPAKVSLARRFWFNTIVAAEDAWADHEATMAAVHPLARAEYARPEHDTVRAGWGLIAPDEPCVMFGDGSKSNDTTALVLTRLSDGHKVVIGAWSKPAGKRGETWLSPREDVDARVAEAFKRFTIVGFWFDPSHTFDDDGGRYWDGMVDRWHRLYKDRLTHWAVKTGDSQHSVMWDMTSPQRTKEFTGAAERYIEDLEYRDPETGLYAPRFTIDANPLLISHHDNARKYATSFGTSLSKVNKDSKKKIDLAVCAVGSEMLARIVLNREEEEEDDGPGAVWGRW